MKAGLEDRTDSYTMLFAPIVALPHRFPLNPETIDPYTAVIVIKIIVRPKMHSKKGNQARYLYDRAFSID
jgi:hypothetical protein